MDVNKVRFGNYSIGNPQNGAPKKNEKEASESQTQNQQAQNPTNFNVDNFYSAMNVAGMQNLAFINRAEVQMPNPADFLSEERIRDIEASMVEFETGVNNIVGMIEDEFPNIFTDAMKNDLAANIFAQD